MSINKIITKETAIDTLFIYAGSANLKKEMQRIKVDYTKICKGLKTTFVLKNQNFGKITVTL
jgi:hypothetical protein